jgi:hypothetical protein
MEQYNFINELEYSKYILDEMKKENGFFIGRIAGSDYSAVRNYISSDKNVNNMNYSYYYKMVKQLNGYFDKETDQIKQKENFKNYLESMLKCYTESDVLLNPCGEIQRSLEILENNNFNKFICEKKPMLHYHWIETIKPFLNDFKVFAQNKKVLIISPFSESIKFQYKRIDVILKNYTYPDFELVTYDTPITYNNEKDSLSHIETNNWLEQCQKMENDIMKLDFDIALLSCASYAMYLGNVISKKMNKKAIYIGGVINVFFNIQGKRYLNDTYYDSLKNLEYEIVALEKPEKCDILFGGKHVNSESLLAYF